MPARFGSLPAAAAWRLRDALEGFEVVFPASTGDGYRLDGSTTAVEDGQPWTVRYEIVLDEAWRTWTARVWGRSPTGEHEVRLDADGPGSWRVDDVAAPHLDGCLDVDIESLACTNSLPVHRLALDVGQESDAPAAYVRWLDLSVERLEQHYVRVDDADGRQRFHYTAPVFDYDDHLVYDASGLVLDYPGIGTRVL
jgi:uncharacterized protein